MTVSYIAPNEGDDTANPLGTESNPRRTPPTQADHMVWRFKRGTTWNRTTQLGISAQGMILTDYGNPDAPKPKIEAIQPASSASVLLNGDTIFANIHFDLIDRTGTETSASNVGQHCVSHNRRGGGASPTKLVSGAYIGCSFTRLGNNAINVGSNSDGQYADAAPVLLVLGCDFDTIGNDAIYGSVGEYCEIGHNRASNFGTRADSNSDFVNLIACSPEYVWIHDNYVDHTTDDRKHLIMLDIASGQTGGLAVIERNVLLGYGANAPYAQAAQNAGVNLEMKAIFRQNYVRGSRLLYVVQSVVPTGSEAYGNIFDFTGSGSAYCTSIAAPGSAFYNNTLISRNRLSGSLGSAYSSTATNAMNSRNLYVGFTRAIGTTSSRGFITGENNRFSGVTNKYWDITNTVALADGMGDADFSEVNLMSEYGLPVRPRRDALIYTMANVDRKVPDFWGRFAPDGIGYIGALMERGITA
ncbi:hypothetical protein O4H66_17315 [Comamonadaceae bacterium G21597-S1]|nr:hypothetical protein [Comamonadaceae bacterium G21597-S1]